VALTVTELTAVVEEIAPILAGGWIQKIYQPADRTLVLEIRAPGRTHRLLISCHPETARLHFTTAAFHNPPTPPPFCQFLRAHLQGARIDQVEQIQGDRIAQLALTAKEGSCRLVAELTGKTSNLLVLDNLGRIRRDLNEGKDLVGQLYVPPTRQQRERGAADHVRFSQDTQESPFPLSAAIDAHYHRAEAASVVAAVRNARAGILRKSIKKLRRRIEAWHEDLAKAEKYKAYARYGELIKANLGTIRKGQTDVTVVDYFDEELPNLTIPLDQTKTPQGNMDDYFRKHRKHLAAERELHPRVEEGERELETLQRELTAIEQGTWQPPDKPHLTMRARALSRTGGGKGRQEQRQGPFRRFTSSDGLAMYVGRNARENDELTFGVAKSDDLWLHARGTPGSHVVVRLEKGADVPPETLRDAATLALLYSDLKKSGKGDIIYTRRKWVKKAKGQAPGAVTVSQEKSVFVALDKTRLARLKERSEAV
jgi:predicted ribosome quality control (RQC) complex YloA/Tae2 family protein